MCSKMRFVSRFLAAINVVVIYFKDVSDQPCRRFIERGMIQNYPEWLNFLTMHSSSIFQFPPNAFVRVIRFLYNVTLINWITIDHVLVLMIIFGSCATVHYHTFFFVYSQSSILLLDLCWTYKMKYITLSCTTVFHINNAKLSHNVYMTSFKSFTPYERCIKRNFLFVKFINALNRNLRTGSYEYVSTILKKNNVFTLRF